MKNVEGVPEAPSLRTQFRTRARVRELVDDALSGAALTSAMTKLVAERPGLTSPGYKPPERPAGLDGGVRTRVADEEESVGAVIDRVLRGHPPAPRRYGNGLIE